MDEKYRDLATLHMMAISNAASLTFEEAQKRNKEYHDHRDMCIAKYGHREAVEAEYRGVPPPSTGVSDQ